MKKFWLLLVCVLLLCGCAPKRELLTNPEQYTIDFAKACAHRAEPLSECTLLEARALFLGVDFAQTVAPQAETWRGLDEEGRYFLAEARYVLSFRLRLNGEEESGFFVTGLNGYDLTAYFTGTEAEAWFRAQLEQSGEALSTAKLQKYIF